MDNEDLIKRIIDRIDNKKEELVEISKYIWNNPELGYEEYKAKEILTDYLEKEGFVVEREVKDLETSFIATKKGKENGPRIGIMAEYDALPKIGHACGHNVFSVASVGAAIGLAEVLNDLEGTIVVIGTPAEEGTVPNAGGKAILVKNGVFDNIDVAMMCHAEGETIVERELVASGSLNIKFIGKAAHAGGSPEKGINALTASVLTINNINSIRQHFLPRVIVNPIINEGGVAQNTIPDISTMKLSVRADKKKTLYEVLEVIDRCVQASALVTGCSYETSLDSYIYDDLVPNHVLSNTFKEVLDCLDFPYRDHESTNYAWDVGNVSYVCPAIAPYIKIGSEDLVGHTKEFKVASNSEEGFNGMIIGAKAMALTSLEYLLNPELREKVDKEFKQKVQE